MGRENPAVFLVAMVLAPHGENDMGEYADYEIDRWIGDCNWGSRRRSLPAPVKPSNRIIFRNFAGLDLPEEFPASIECKCGRGHVSRHDGKCGHCRTKKETEALNKRFREVDKPIDYSQF